MELNNVSVVRAFYLAVATKDAAALQTLVRKRFAADAVIRWPESLPHGGELAGVDKLAKVFGGLASPSAPMGLEEVELTDVVDGGDRIVARIEFDWFVRVNGSAESTRTSALEMWTFDGDRVREIRAYYWDAVAVNQLTEEVNTR